MKIVKNIKYWFTREGGDEYELILNKYYEKLKAKTNHVEVILITDKERKIINESIDNFIAKTQEGIIDILDLERS